MKQKEIPTVFSAQGSKGPSIKYVSTFYEVKVMTDRYKKVMTWGKGVSIIAKKALTYFMDGPKPVFVVGVIYGDKSVFASDTFCA
jgi:hypothetical protein